MVRVVNDGGRQSDREKKKRVGNRFVLQHRERVAACRSSPRQRSTDCHDCSGTIDSACDERINNSIATHSDVVVGRVEGR